MVARRIPKSRGLFEVLPTAVSITWFNSIAGIWFSFRLPKFRRGTNYFNMFSAIAFFSFSTFFSQDLRSSIIEPWYEQLPDVLQEVNLNSQGLTLITKIPYLKHVSQWNSNNHSGQDEKSYLESLRSYKMNNTICVDSDCNLVQNTLMKMARDPNAFMVVEKDVYTKEILKLQDFIKGTKGLKGRWEWRMSPKVSGYIMEGGMFKKYQIWSEPLKLHILKLSVSVMRATPNMIRFSSYLMHC